MCKDGKKNYRLGIDLGSTSLGWCMLEIDEERNPIGIINMGVRIFPDGRDAKSKEPLSVARRGYRGQRRNLDRYLQRLKELITYLQKHGFLPADEAERREVFKLNPYMLRAKALDEALSPSEFARAIIHLSKRRGFRSNRKIQSDKKTAYTEAIDNLKTNLESNGARTLGEYLWLRYQQMPEGKEHLRNPIKFRYEIKLEDPNPIFPLREMVEHEFDAIWQAQSKYSPLFSETHKQNIFAIIFTQRDLKKQAKGKCQLLPEFTRAPKAHPLFQEFRIRQDLNNLKARDMFNNTTIELTDAQYNTLFQALSTSKERSFEQLRKAIYGKQAEDYRFNLEANDRKKLLGDLTYAEINRKGNEAVRSYWEKWSLEMQAQVIEIVISDLDDEPTLVELSELGIPKDIASALLDLHLPSEYCHLSTQAMEKILPFMRQRTIYSEACKLAGMDHSGEFTGEVFTDGSLPYYGELLKRETIELNRQTGDNDADESGKINNPTVHIALNQLRKLVNAICKRYGAAPKEIVLELGKDIKLGEKEKERLNKQANKNKKINETVDELLRYNDIKPNHLNRLKAKLWLELGASELDRRCVYSGHQIAVNDLFTSKVEIDHILPKSRTYDDSTSNKILCIIDANHYKKERSPYEAFGESKDGYRWEDIVSRANNLPDNKKWRFQADAMQDYANKEEILARMLNDTRYMSRVANKYMCYICGINNVWTITGRHTGMLRAKWGLNAALGDDERKDRSDHRHHAIDAFVIALTNRAMIHRLATTIENSRERFIENLEPPYTSFNHEEFKQKVNSIVTSFKPDQINPEKLQSRNQTGGSLVQETAYSFEGIDPDNPKYNLYAVRKSVSDVTEKNYQDIAAPEFRKELEAIAKTYTGKDFQAQVSIWAKRRNIKKVKLISSMNPDGMVPILNKEGIAFKFMASGENLFADIYIKDPADPKVKWSIEIVNSYKAHQPGFTPQWKQEFPKAKKLMRVFKNDIIAIDTPDGGRELRRVKKMTKGALFLRESNIAKKDKALDDIGEQFSPNKLFELHARKAGVDMIGRWFDPIVNEHE
ncbi:MAG: type II CRISPR RNA-guided endonuclease Cas9 [Candidatus Cloacimonetes bacterium HGW-Cloacimonetes-3]|jgi:CRISPR-associated endonuclease Csn1|nr:MAG: type II CRISPR RNA-guided endonuclease Cas9 [Candidatus Cloacimonetes bacterium HGW-Cloacimonetes-3]